MIQLDQLPTEQQNPNTACIDRLSTLDMVRVINDEDKKVAFAVEKELVSIAAAVDAIYEALKAGGRLIYCGCGTSGRLGILDAVECPPTFSTDPEMVQGVIAGGEPALFRAAEGAEDNVGAGREDMEKINLNSRDVLVGIAASGRTPYVLGAMAYAKELGAVTVAVTCNKHSQMNAARGHPHRRGAGSGGHNRLDPPQVRDGAEDGAQHALHGRDDTPWKSIRQPHGGCKAHQREAGPPRDKDSRHGGAHGRGRGESGPGAVRLLGQDRHRDAREAPARGRGRAQA